MARANIFGARKAEIKRPTHFYRSRIHTYPALLTHTSLRFLVPTSFTPLFRHFLCPFYSAREKHEARASVSRWYLTRVTSERNLSFFFLFSNMYLKLELVSLFGEFRAIISPNNIFALAQIQIFIFTRRESCNVRFCKNWINRTKFYVKDWNPIDSRMENGDGKRCRAATHDRAASGLTIKSVAVPSPSAISISIGAQHIFIEYAFRVTFLFFLFSLCRCTLFRTEVLSLFIKSRSGM